MSAPANGENTRHRMLTGYSVPPSPGWRIPLPRRARTGLFFCLMAIVAFGFAGCGRRGALEPPPGASPPEAAADPQAAPASTGAPVLKPAHRASKKIVPPKVDTPFDWLL